MIELLLLTGLAAIGAICLVAMRGGRPLVSTAGRRDKSEPPHRQAIHHFASGVLPPWR